MVSALKIGVHWRSTQRTQPRRGHQLSLTIEFSVVHFCVHSMRIGQLLYWHWKWRQKDRIVRGTIHGGTATENQSVKTWTWLFFFPFSYPFTKPEHCSFACADISEKDLKIKSMWICIRESAQHTVFLQCIGF